MKKITIISVIILLSMSILGGWTSYPAPNSQKKTYQYNDPNITFSGRVLADDQEKITYFDWTCSGFQFKFEGNKVDADLKAMVTEEYGNMLYPWVAVFVDDFEEPYKLIKLEEGQTVYTLFESKEFGTHDIKVVRRTEALHSKTGLKAINVYGKNAKIKELPSDQQYKIEFIGDSITCGYGNEGTKPEDGFQSAQENGWETFAAKTARALNADFNCVSISGIGIHANWTPVDKLNELLLMPEIYGDTDTYLDLKKDREITKWDFKTFNPDLIVINLGTNDMSYVQYDQEARFPVFKQRYIDFIKQVKEKNGKDVKIICTILPPTEEIGNLFKSIVDDYKQVTGDKNIEFLVLSPPQPEDGIGGSWHPTIKTHERMSQELTTEIREWLHW